VGYLQLQFFIQLNDFQFCQNLFKYQVLISFKSFPADSWF